MIVGTLWSFASGQAPPELIVSGNAAAFIEVRDAASNPITNATVTVNGVPLIWSAQYQDYGASLNVAAGTGINVVVGVGGTNYTLTTSQYLNFPVITEPAQNAIWHPDTTNSVRWQSSPPDASTSHILSLLGEESEWPSNGLLVLPSQARSHDIPAFQLATDDYLLLVGMSRELAFSGARSGSTLFLDAYAYKYVAVQPAPTSVTGITLGGTLQPAVLLSGTNRQLTATAQLFNSTQIDVATTGSWHSSNTQVASVSATGLVTAVGQGTATISISFGGRTAQLEVRVIMPLTSLPVGPLTDSVAMQVDHAHTGRATLGGPAAALPLQGRWTKTLNGVVSYPVVAGDKVFVTTNSPATGNPDSYDSSLYALNVSTGDVIWGPVNVPGTYDWSGHAYDQGRIFVLKFNGVLRSYDAQTGALQWTLQLPESGSTASTPVAANGLVYVTAPGKAYAVDQFTGSIVWSAPARAFGHSTPALTPNGLFISSGSASALDPQTGSALWHFDGASGGTNGRVAVLAENRLFIRTGAPEIYTETGTRNAILNPTTGAVTGTFNATTIPAVANGRGFFLADARLAAVDLATQLELWSFTGDGHLVSPPLVIDNLVVVGSDSGNVYLLDATSGTERWVGTAGAGLSTPDERNFMFPLTSMGVGAGYLLVPGGNTLTGWRMVP